MAQTVCRFYILSDLSKLKIWEISSEKKLWLLSIISERHFSGVYGNIQV